VLPLELVTDEVRRCLSAADRIRLKRCCKALYDADPGFKWPPLWKEYGKELLDPSMDDKLVDALLTTSLAEARLVLVFSNGLEFKKRFTSGRSGLPIYGNVVVGTGNALTAYCVQIQLMSMFVTEFSDTAEQVDACFAEFEKTF
jgi:hypothetical protein